MEGPTTPSPTGVNLGALLARIHGNTAAMQQLVELMLGHLPERLAAIDDALAKGDSSALGAAAHSLRGSLSNFTVGQSWVLAGDLEALARSEKMDGAGALAASLHTEVDAVEKELKAWLAQGLT